MIKLVIFVGLLSVSFAAISKRQVYGPIKVVPTYPTGQIIPILRQDSDISPDGTYHYIYETGNGISAEESGRLTGTGETAGTAAQGGFQYTSPEGLLVSIKYIADENGFQPVGDVLPTSPPIPAAILRSIEYNDAHPDPQQGAYNQQQQGAYTQPQYYPTTPVPYRRV